MSKDYVLWDDAMAHSITGLDPDGNPIQLGPDVCLYWRLGAVEQGALNRIGLGDETLADEIQGTPGNVAMGNPEDLRLFLHDLIDDMFGAIYLNRSVISKADLHNLQHRKVTLDDLLGVEEIIDATE